MGIIITGDIDEIDDAMPAAVYFTAINEQVIPTKDPNTDPNIINFRTPRLPNAVLISAHFRLIVIMATRAIIAADNLIWVAANGL